MVYKIIRARIKKVQAQDLDSNDNFHSIKPGATTSGDVKLIPLPTHPGAIEAQYITWTESERSLSEAQLELDFFNSQLAV